jgi:hypothetical protein
VYGSPMVDCYRICWAYFADKGGPAYKTPINTLYNTAEVYTPADKIVQTPNSDTPHSFALLASARAFESRRRASSRGRPAASDRR